MLSKTIVIASTWISAALAFSGLARAQGDSARPAGYHVVKTTVLGGPERYNRLTMDSDARRLYIARETLVQVMNVDTGAIAGTITGLKAAHGVALVPELSRAFVTNGGDDSVAMVDVKSLQKIGTVKTGKNPDAIIYDDVSKRIFVMNADSRDATAIDTVSGTAIGTVELGGQPQSAVADGKGSVFVNIADKAEIAEINARTLAAAHHWPLTPCEGPSGLAMDQKNRRLFAACDDKVMVVVDADSGKIVAKPSIGFGPYMAGFDPDTQLVFSSNGAGTLTVIREDSPGRFSVLGNVKTDWLARHMAIDEKTHSVYTVWRCMVARDLSCSRSPPRLSKSSLSASNPTQHL